MLFVSTPSINSLIPSADFSMQYSTVDGAINLIRLAGKGAWLAKADITAAFKVLPLHPDFWHLFGVRWQDQFYFAVRLTFGCKSSPKLFDTLAEALCWILVNNHKLPYVTHLLDDFLVVTPPSAPPASGLTTLTTVFNSLGVPLALEKTEGPLTALEFLGITLDTISFQASLPPDKLNRTTLLLSNYLDVPHCTKQQLLSLLGHLVYAMRIIPQGRSFISNLLQLSTSVGSLHHQVTFDPPCQTELRLWHLLLTNWNGITFFYNDYISSPEDINLYTDAAPSVGFGGYYAGRWFSSPWPDDFTHLDPDHAQSSALYELYPIVIAATLWGSEWTSQSILIHTDNLATVHIINKGRSSSLPIMSLLRRLTWLSVTHQFLLRAAHVPGHHNSIADSLSRFLFQKFKTLAPHSDPHPVPVPPFSDIIFP